MRFRFDQLKRKLIQHRGTLAAVALALLAVAANFLPLSPGNTLSAQDVGQTIGGYERHPSQMTDAQYIKLQDEKGRIKPGLYNIRSMGSGYCIGYMPWNAFDNMFKTAPCNTNTGTFFYIVPHNDGYTIRRVLVGERQSIDREKIRGCATTGRGTIIGPRPTNIIPCDLPTNSTTWEAAGAPDQIYDFRRVGNGPLYEIRPKNIEGDCLSIERNSLDQGVAIISWACNGEAGQRFELINYEPLVAPWESKLIADHGWLLGPDGYQHISPTGGVDMSGGNYTEFETIADSGKYCASACVSNGAQCKGFTWTAAGFDRPKPMCQLKSSLTQPINRGSSSTSQIISAIVRR